MNKKIILIQEKLYLKKLEEKIPKHLCHFDIDLLIFKSFKDKRSYLLLEKILFEEKIVIGIYQNRLMVEKIYELFGKMEIEYFEENKNAESFLIKNRVGTLNAIERMIQDLTTKGKTVYYYGDSIIERRRLGKYLPREKFLSPENLRYSHLKSGFTLIAHLNSFQKEEELRVKLGYLPGEIILFKTFKFKNIFNFSSLRGIMADQLIIFKLYLGLC